MAHQTLVGHDLVVLQADDRLEQRAQAAGAQRAIEQRTDGFGQGRDGHGRRTLAGFHDNQASTDEVIVL
jgi:hypothetical protein